MRAGGRIIIGMVATILVVASDVRAVDFDADIRPILVSRCVRCHGSEKQQGGLRLDEREHALAGGESGQPVIETAVDQNELWRRIQSPMAELRMPLDGPPLSDTELARLQAWVNAGAVWPTKPSPPLKLTNTWTNWFDDQIGAWDPLIVRMRPTLFLGTGLLVVLVVVSRIARARCDEERAAAPRWLPVCARLPSPAAYLLIVLAVVIHAALIQADLHREKVAKLDKLIASLRDDLSAANEKYAPPKDLVRPAHPRAVQRTYYRGNDERSPHLFNGGFYRTATIDLTLLDSAGEALAMGKACASGPIRLRFEIRRAKNATTVLFTDDIGKKIFLSPLPQDQRITDRARQVSPLELVEPSEYWRGSVTLGQITGSGAERVAARWYVIHGTDPQVDETTGVAHYGIDTSLSLRDGIIQPDSDLWMAALLHAPKTIATPPNYLHSSEWLDIRPIPEIEGAPSSDPVLLGTPQHAVPSTTKSN